MRFSQINTSTTLFFGLCFALLDQQSAYAQNLATSSSKPIAEIVQPASKVAAKTEVKPELPIQQMATLLAGKDLGEAMSPALKANPLWQSYSKQVQSNWGQYSKAIGTPMMNWAKAELNQKAPSVFYPFSGPDFATLHQLYPQANRYVMIAMQRAERPINLMGLSPEASNQTLEVLISAWSLYGKDGFFVTEYLDKYLYKNQVRIGASTFLATFLNLYGYTIDSVVPIQVSERGELVEINLQDVNSKDEIVKKAWASVRFKLRKNGKPVVLDYLSMDLSNKGFESKPHHLQFVRALLSAPVLFKAASHLPQNKTFDVIADEVLTRAPVVVQDETGIKYSSLSTHFDVALYGNFEKTHRLFKNYHKDLGQAYDERKDIKPLGFRVGYFKDGDYAFMIATRKKMAQTR